MKHLGLQSCPTLCDPMHCSLPGSSVPEIFQARILEWLPFPALGYLPDLGFKLMSLTSPALAVSSLPLAPLGKGTFKAPKILSGSYMCV